MPHAQLPNPLCPWGCRFRADLIDFCLERIDSELYVRGMTAWQTGGGLIGPCPVCRREVIFQKGLMIAARADTAANDAVALPADWHAYAVFALEDGTILAY
jgi:hypothetical protein